MTQAPGQRKSKTEGSIRVSALEIKQGLKWPFYVITLDSKVLLRLCTVSRREDDRQRGYQRHFDERRAREIADFVDQRKGYIANNIILNFTGDVRFDENKQQLVIPKKENIAWVVDGQHRLFGLLRANRGMELSVAAFIGLPDNEAAKLFQIINSKQRPVSASLIYDLLELTKEGLPAELRGHDLVKRLNEDGDSPWFGQIKMIGRGPGAISQAQFMRLLLPLIRRTPSPAGALSRLGFEEQYAYLRDYFKAVQRTYHKAWMGKGYALTKSLGFGALMLCFQPIFIDVLAHNERFTEEAVAKRFSKAGDFDFSGKTLRGMSGRAGEQLLGERLLEQILPAV
jgi:DGQHR domain-containing protein